MLPVVFQLKQNKFWGCRGMGIRKRVWELGCFLLLRRLKRKMEQIQSSPTYRHMHTHAQTDTQIHPGRHMGLCSDTENPLQMPVHTL